MGEILTVTAFLKILRQSGLLEEEVLERRLRELRNAGLPLEHPQALVDALVGQRILTRWQADMLLAGKHRGFVLGKYRLLSLLGQGGMGSVYLAEHRMMRRRVAIKVLPPRKSGDSTFVSRFQREARAAATLDHLNIVRMFDIDTDHDKETVVHFLVMEYVDGGSLQDLVTTRGPLDFATAADFVRQAADGLAHAHASGVVHRDVTPANVLVDSAGVVKILDLGLAQLYSESVAGGPSEEPHHYVGTADYLAPEQAIDSMSVDPRADLYGLGCTFYFLLAGHPPFPGGTAAQKLIAHQTFEPKPIEESRPDIPDSLASILRKMMAKKKTDRWQSATEVSQALQNWLAAHPAKLRREQPAAKDTRHRPPPQQSAADVDKRSGRAKSDEQRAGVKNASTPLADAVKTPTNEAHYGTATRASRSRSSRRFVLFLTGMFVVLLLSYLGIYLNSGPSPRDVSSTVNSPAEEGTAPLKADSPTQVDDGKVGPPGPRSRKDGPADPLNVTVGPKGDFRTIQEAIAHVRSANSVRRGRTELVVRVAGGTTYPERIVIDNSDLSFPDRVRILSEGDQRAVLAPDGTEPVVKLTGPTKGAERFTLDGFKILANGKPVAIELEGYLVGTALVNLEVEGFTKTGLMGNEVRGLGSGNERDQFTISKVLFHGETGAEGIRVTGARSGHFRIHECRFLGPMKSGIVIRDGMADIQIKMNLFCSTDRGVFFGGIGPELRDIRLENNAFHNNHRSIAFATFPASDSRGLSFRGNLFLESSGYECSVDGPSEMPAFLSMLASGGIRDNWSDRPGDKAPSQPAGTEIDIFQQNGHRGAEFHFKSLSSESPDFLVPLAEAPHRSAGPFQVK